MRMGVDRKRGLCIALLVVMLLNIQYRCGAASLEVNSSTGSWCKGSVGECLTMDLEFDLFVGSEISRILGSIKPGLAVTPGSENKNKPAVPGEDGTSYGNNLPPKNGGASNCGQHNKECHDIYKKPK